MMNNLKPDDEIFITCDGKTIAGKVDMISGNQVSALITFDGMLNGHIGAMPITRHNKDAGIYRSIIDGTEITMRRK